MPRITRLALPLAVAVCGLAAPAANASVQAPQSGEAKSINFTHPAAAKAINFTK
jgi:hypothetical protein